MKSDILKLLAAHAEIVRKIEREKTKEAQLQAQLAAHKLLCNARISRARKEGDCFSRGKAPKRPKLSYGCKGGGWRNWNLLT